MRVLAMLASLVLAGCLAPATELAPQETPSTRLPVSAWTAQLSEPVYEGVVSATARIRAEDGTSLSLSYHLPEGLPAGERIPTLLRLTPYVGGAAPGPLGYGYKSTPLGTEAPRDRWFPPHIIHQGAAFVEGALRGTGASGGCIDFGGAADRADASAFVAWVRAQPWSNGVVVTEGISHDGMASVATHAAVPDLTAAVAYAPGVSYYRDQWSQGAAYDFQPNGVAYSAIEVIPAIYVEPEALLNLAEPCTGKGLVDFELSDGRFGPLWAERDNARHAQNARAPLLMTSGFADVSTHGGHVHSYWNALPEDHPKWSIWGWFPHNFPNMTTHPVGDYQLLRQRWIDATVFGKANGMFDEPRVLVEDQTGVWHEGDAWPLDGSERRRLYASGDGALVGSAAAEGAFAYRDRLEARRGTWTDAHVAFRTEPLDEARLVTGAPQVRLVASSDATETKWVVYLLDEAPDGSWERVSHGYADSHTHGAEDQWLELAPGREYAWTVELLPTGYVLLPGHRLVLLVASRDTAFDFYPERWDLVDDTAGYKGTSSACWSDGKGGCMLPPGIRPAATTGRATNTVYAGPAATWVDLDWIDPALTRKPT